jgi:plasmid stabilization system protein ParE
MPQLIWSEQALKDVLRLYRFLSPHNPDSARRAATAIRHGVRLLEHQPGVGRPMADMEPEYREWLIDFGDSGYVALYRLAGDRVVILAVRHQRELGY